MADINDIEQCFKALNKAASILRYWKSKDASALLLDAEELLRLIEPLKSVDLRSEDDSKRLIRHSNLLVDFLSQDNQEMCRSDIWDLVTSDLIGLGLHLSSQLRKINSL